MAASSKNPPESRNKGGLRPMFVAGGLGLLWFVKFQAGPLPVGVPGWGVSLLLAGQLAADFVCAAVVVAAVRLAWSAVHLGVANWRSMRRREVE